MKDKGGENRWNTTQYRRGFGLGWVRCTLEREREAMSMSASLSFLQSACAYSQQQRLYLRPKLECLGSSSSYQPLIVEAKARTRREDRAARHSRLRKKVEGTPERPRLCVFRSNKHLYVQVIDDTKMHTLASASTMQKPISEEFNYSSGPTIDVAKKVGEVIAKSCLDKGITKVAFDRGGYLYHGRIEAVADAAREHDGVAVAVVDVLHITHAAIATVGSNAGVSNDSSPNMMQKFWDSAMALSPDEEEDAESDSSFKLASESIETTRSLPYPSSIVPNTFAFKIQDKNGRMRRFNCDTQSLTDLVTAILQMCGLQHTVL